MLTKEIFKDIKNYEGLYQVSNLGNVKSLPKSDGNGYTERYLKFDKSAAYYRVSLSKNGKVKRFSVHRLVAEAFIDNPLNKEQVNHINHITTDNFVENLEWCTSVENMEKSAALGRQEKPRILGSIKASENAQNRAILKYTELLGERFIETYTVKVKNSQKRFIKYKCICNNIYNVRSDNLSLTKRKGICNQCKGEDIV